MPSNISAQDANEDLQAIGAAPMATPVKKKSKRSASAPLALLPIELLNIINRFTINTAYDCAKLERVCKPFYKAINNSNLVHNCWVSLVYCSNNCGTKLLTIEASAFAKLQEEFQRMLNYHLLSFPAVESLPFPQQVKSLAKHTLQSYRLVTAQDALQHYVSQIKYNQPYGNYGECKIAVMGVSGVGKSTTVDYYVHGLNYYNYSPTIEDSYYKPMTIQGTNVAIEILDTAGQEEYQALRDQWVSNFFLRFFKLFWFG